MTTATATAEKQTALVAPTANVGRELDFGMDREKVELLKRTVAKGATDDQFALFMTTAHRLQLDPFARQIYCVLRAVKGGGFEMAIQTGIDGLRAVAARTKETDGQDGPWWAGLDGVWRDTWTSNEPPLVAKVLVYRKGASRPFPGVAHLKSYATFKDDGKTLAQKWAAMPENMLAKCAEALALRKAFPVEMGDVYIPEEMDQADRHAIDVPVIEKLALPPAVTAPQVDTWAVFLADLAPLAAGFAEAVGTPVAMWDENDLIAAWERILEDNETIASINEHVGRWSVVLNAHKVACSRVARVKEAKLDGMYKARTAKLRADAAAAKALAQNGATP